MRTALAIIAVAVLAMAAGGAMFLRGGEYAMFLLALGLVCFFGALPVLLGVLTRPRARGEGPGHTTVVVHRDAPPPPSPPGSPQ